MNEVKKKLNAKSWYKANKYKYNFQQYESIRSFGENIYTGKINVDDTEVDQSNLLKKIGRI